MFAAAWRAAPRDTPRRPGTMILEPRRRRRRAVSGGYQTARYHAASVSELPVLLPPRERSLRALRQTALKSGCFSLHFWDPYRPNRLESGVLPSIPLPLGGPVPLPVARRGGAGSLSPPGAAATL